MILETVNMDALKQNTIALENGPEIVGVRPNFGYEVGIVSVKQELRPGKRTCQCPECGCFFVSPSSFDAHQIGQHTANPKCMTSQQMRAAGLVQNDYGVWHMGSSKKHDRRQAA